MQRLEKAGKRQAEIDRRDADRRPFTATAEVTDPASNSRLTGRIADLGRGGCYVDLLNTIPAGTPVMVRIRHANRQFQAKGTVSYVLERMGMGVAFTEVSNESALILEEWLGLRAPEEAHSSHESPRAVTPRKVTAQREVLSRLIKLLGKQRVIAPDDAVELLSDLIGEE
jgi:hypothetical protein